MKAQLFEITHTTVYSYQEPVTHSHNLVRLAPRRLPRQMPLAHTAEIDPHPTSTLPHFDYFGNSFVFACIAEAHRSMRVTARSTVAVGPAAIPDASETPSWESVRALCYSDRSPKVLEAVEFIFPSEFVPSTPEYADFAAASFLRGRPIMEAAVDLAGRIFSEFSFDPTSTTVSTPLSEVLSGRRGVCQDFAHLAIACFRSLGLPARYVSGHIETIPPPGQPKLVGADASHAWVAFFCPGVGWIDIDPTNNLLPSMQHVTVAWGRDYGDVSPIRGVVCGGGEHSLDVSVDMRPRGIVNIQGG